MYPQLALLLVLVAAAPQQRPAGLPPPNVALGKPYTLTPQPNYPFTTDPGDATQLTDGEKAGGRFWTDKAAVGWVGEKLVTITVDLGAVYEIAGASFSTAAGISDVEWPTAILVMGSVDGRGYGALADLAAVDEATDRPLSIGSFDRHTYVSHGLSGQARLVRFMVAASGPYVFADEVEIFGTPAVASRPVPSTTLDPNALFWRMLAASRLRKEVQRSLHEARARLVGARLAPAYRDSLASRLDGLERAASRLTDDEWSGAKTQYPMNDVHSAAFEVIGAIEAAEGTPPLTAWPAGPWSPLDMTTTRPSGSRSSLEVFLMNGEARSAALNVRNSAAAGSLTASVDLADIDALEPGWVEGRPVAWSGDGEGKPVALAVLPPNPRAAPPALVVPAGVTRQLWLTFSPKNIGAGRHELVLRVIAPGRPEIAVPVNITILPGRFPRSPRLHVQGWDYLEDRPGAPASNELTDIALLLRAFGVDLPWATAAAMPFGRYDASGRMTGAPDTKAFDSWIRRWPGAERYRVYVGAHDELSGIRRGTPAFSAAVRSWAGYWESHAAALGVSSATIDLLFVDEPHGVGDDAARQIDWARALRASGTGFSVWSDPVYPDPTAVPVELIRTAGTLCLNRQIFDLSGTPYRRLAQTLRDKGKVVELYGTNGPSSTLDPYTYYRLMAWRAFDVGATSVGFWSFTDTGSASSWREYSAPRTNFSPLFIGEGSVAPGKHLYAIREGAEDFEYLALLQDSISRAGHQADGARALLTSSISNVLSISHREAYTWQSGTDRTAADAARVRIAEELRRLSIAAPP